MTGKLLFDGAKCSACGACAVACMDQNDIDTDSGQVPYIRAVCREEGLRFEYIARMCLHCTVPPCADACPQQCLYKDRQTGLTLYDNTACVGCGCCAVACPHGAITFRKTPDGPSRGRMEKCDACHIRQEAGLLPACVRACPTGALRLSCTGPMPDKSDDFERKRK